MHRVDVVGLDDHVAWPSQRLGTSDGPWREWATPIAGNVVARRSERVGYATGSTDVPSNVVVGNRMAGVPR
jgi:hypothetical protein